MISLLKRTYSLLPIHLQNVAVTGYGLYLDHARYRGRYEEYQKFLEHSQFWTITDMESWQDERLRMVIQNAYANVPFYRNRFDQIGLKPQDISTQDDLYKVPLLTRKDIVDNFDDLIACNIDRRKLNLGHTSGTTGSPLEVLYDSDTVELTYALLDRQYRWAGVNFGHRGDRIGVLRGNVIVPLKQTKPPFWRYNRYQNQLLLSAFHMSPENLGTYADEIRRFGPIALDGYPSTLYVIARFLLSNGKTLPMKAVITGSETLYAFQRHAIEEAFQCRVFDYLAAAERVVFSAECDRHEGHHICSEYGIAEFLDNNGDPVDKGVEGMLVCTTLVNGGMPLIRYVTNDVSTLKFGKCSCHRGLPLMEDVTTKAEDILFLSDGRLISPSVLTHPFKPMHSVQASQIVQEAPDSIEIRVLPGEGYCEKDTEHLLREFRERLGSNVYVRVTLVEELERSASGKFKWVISRVDNAIQVSD